MKKITKVLLKTKKNLLNHNFSKGAYARKANGYACRVLDPDVKCLCFLGAYAKALNIDPYNIDLDDTSTAFEFNNLFNRVTNNRFVIGDETCPYDFNDQASKKKVLQVLDAMIVLSKVDV